MICCFRVELFDLRPLELESQSPVPKCKIRSETACRCSEGADEIPDSEEEDGYCLMPQINFVNESFAVQSESPDGEFQVIDELHVDPETVQSLLLSPM